LQGAIKKASRFVETFPVENRGYGLPDAGLETGDTADLKSALQNQRRTIARTLPALAVTIQMFSTKQKPLAFPSNRSGPHHS
jgi:hypothetical protein